MPLPRARSVRPKPPPPMPPETAPDLTHVPARQIDAFLAVRLFGLALHRHADGDITLAGERAGGSVTYAPVPRYSTDAEGAEAVIEAVKTRPFSVRRAFSEALREQARTEAGDYIAWPDALLHLVGRWPRAVALAAAVAEWPSAPPEARALLGAGTGPTPPPSAAEPTDR